MNVKLIKTEAENDAALERLGELMGAAPAEGTPACDEMLLLSTLIQRFERERYPFDKPDPIDAIRFRMDQQGMKPADMAPFFGTVSRFYEIMKGRRRLTLAMIRKLHRQLGIPADILIREPTPGMPDRAVAVHYPSGADKALAVHDAPQTGFPANPVRKRTSRH